jgi:hypothetical protein
MKKNYTHLEVILDKSGSMAPTISDTLGSLNTFIAKQKEVPGTCSFRLTQFNATVSPGVHVDSLADVATITAASYVPRGNTALLDAIGMTCKTLGERLAELDEADRPEKVIVVIVTDGAENASKFYTRNQINEIINHQRNKYSWEFTFLGANQDAIQVGTSLGVAKGAALTYAGGQMVNSTRSLNRIISDSRMKGTVIGTSANSYSDSERAKAMGVDLNLINSASKAYWDEIKKTVNSPEHHEAARKFTEAPFTSTDCGNKSCGTVACVTCGPDRR